MYMYSLQWRHNECDGVSNHQPHDCLLNRLFRRRSKKISISASLAYVRGIHRSLVNSPHKGPVTWKMFSFDEVIMLLIFISLLEIGITFFVSFKSIIHDLLRLVCFDSISFELLWYWKNESTACILPGFHLLQYPGVAESIDSDIDNLMGILKVWNILPEGE